MVNEIEDWKKDNIEVMIFGQKKKATVYYKEIHPKDYVYVFSSDYPSVKEPYNVNVWLYVISAKQNKHNYIYYEIEATINRSGKKGKETERVGFYSYKSRIYNKKVFRSIEEAKKAAITYYEIWFREQASSFIHKKNIQNHRLGLYHQ